MLGGFCVLREPPPDRLRHTHMATRTQVLAPLGTVVAVVAVAAAVTLLSPGSGAHRPKVLRLATESAPKVASGLASGGGSGGGYRLVGTLPAGTPDDAAAWTFTPSARTGRLASALHTTPAALRVSHDPSQSWTYSPCAEDTSVSSSDGATGCAVAPPGVVVPPPAVTSGSGTSSSSGSGAPVAPDAPASSPVPLDTKPLPLPPHPVAKDVIVTAAAPVFTALGLDVSEAVVETGPYGGTATLDPTVGGLQTVGHQTTVNVDRTGTIQYASGWLGDPTKGDSYPLITAQQAFDALPALLHPDLCRLPAPDNEGGCAAAPTPQITGAHLGLLMQPLQDHSQALVPAWLFEVTGSTYPVAQVAVAPTYLASDEPAPIASDQPVPAPPVDPVGTKVTVAIDRATRVKAPNAVVVQYTDNGCPWQHVADEVKEDAGTVYVVLQADPKPAGQACTEIATTASVTVELQAPLGDRKVVDASTAKAVPVS
jgi:hypothetical protein